MAIEWMVQVWDLDIPAKDQRVLLLLANHANGDGICWPSIGRMAWALGTSENTVRRAIDDLEMRGLVHVIKRQGTSSLYRLDFTGCPCKPPYQAPTPSKMEPPPLPKWNPTPLQNGTLTVNNPKEPKNVDVPIGTRAKRAASIADLSGEDAAIPNGRSRKRTDERVWAMVTEYCRALGVPKSRLTTSQQNRAYDSFAAIPGNVPVGDVERCTRYLRTVWKYREAGALQARHVADSYAAWSAEGKPDREGAPRAPGANQAPTRDSSIAAMVAAMRKEESP